jgi:hypothetical protein
VVAVRDHLDAFGDSSIAVVTFAAARDLGAYRRNLDLPFPVLADPNREVYRAFGVGRGSLRRVFGVGTMRLYRRLMAEGYQARAPVQDMLQLGGDFVIAPDGTLAAGFWPQSPDDRPTVEQLIDAVRRARG